jgi:ribosomal protein S18 acetylase RimI-like enzyme
VGPDAPPAVLTLRAANDDDFPAIWEIFRLVIAPGDTYAFPMQTTRAQARRIWTAPPAAAFIAEEKARIVGTYTLKPNQPGHGDHVANCAYMTHPDARGRGVGTALCEHSLETARQRGYVAMQFNFVVASNNGAIRLWEKHGFRVVGRVPGAFRHPQHGLTDTLIMHRAL